MLRIALRELEGLTGRCQLTFQLRTVEVQGRITKIPVQHRPQAELVVADHLGRKSGAQHVETVSDQ